MWTYLSLHAYAVIVVAQLLACELNDQLLRQPRCDAARLALVSDLQSNSQTLHKISQHERTASTPSAMPLVLCPAVTRMHWGW